MSLISNISNIFKKLLASPDDRIQYQKITNIQNSVWHSPVSSSKLRIGK